MAITEKLELLGKGLYTDIPDIITLKSLPTISELEFVGNDDFDETMIEKILPQSVEEDINFNNLLEIDYQWILRCLRIFNYGPYHTTNSVYCPKCGKRITWNAELIFVLLNASSFRRNSKTRSH